MAYQALYRQWRPQDFSHMVGQESVVTTLRNQIMAGRIAHAYLFCGSRGTGKTSTAKIMSRAINCEHPENGDPCGECDSCRRLLKDESLDVMEIDAASNNGVDEIRDLRENVKYPPQYGQYKVYIIDEVHMLSASAFNALLKTLEEPPAHVVFILATTEPQKLPATILSRCQRFDFGRIPAAKIAGRLREAADHAGATATDGALTAIARAAEGGMRDALSILDMCMGYSHEVTEDLVHRVLGTSDISFLFRFGDALAAEDPAAVLGMIDELMRAGCEPQVFSRDVAQHLRCLLMAKCTPDQMDSVLETTREDAAQYVRQAEDFTTARLMQMLELFMSVENTLRWTSSPRVALENAALKACIRTTEADNLALTERIGQLEKQLADLQNAIKEGKIAVKTAGKAEGKGEAKAGGAEKKAAPAKPAPVVGKDAAEQWKIALDSLAASSPGTCTILRMGRITEVRDGTFIWTPPVGSEIFADSMNTPAHKAEIEAALGPATGTEARFQAMKPDTARPDEESEAEKTIRELNRTFGQENVVVQE